MVVIRHLYFFDEGNYTNYFASTDENSPNGICN